MSIDYLKSKFDAVILYIGAGTPRDLPIEGRNLTGIDFALTYLSQSNEFVSGKKKKSEIIFAKRKNVLVIGGRDTGLDWIETANRQGTKKVTQIEIMPKPRECNESYMNLFDNRGNIYIRGVWKYFHNINRLGI